MTKEFRSLEEALVDLLVAQQARPDPKRVLRIEMIRAEIQHRKTAQASPSGAPWKIAATEPGLAV